MYLQYYSEKRIDGNNYLQPSYGTVTLVGGRLGIYDAESQRLILATHGDDTRKLFEALLPTFVVRQLELKDEEIKNLKEKVNEYTIRIGEQIELIQELQEAQGESDD